MNSSPSSRLAAACLALFSTVSWAQQECPRPGLRPLVQMQTAISQDESLAQSFDLAASACTAENQACDDARARCGGQLTQTLQRQITFDEGAFLRDMLIAYQGQQYRMSTPIPSAPALTDVSCNSDSPILQGAAARRRAQAERRKLMLAEYPRWQIWVQQQYQLCLDRAAAEKVRADAQAANAAQLAAAAEVARKAELAKQDSAHAAAQAIKDRAAAEAKAAQDRLDAAAKLAKERADAEAKAREDQLRLQQAAQAEAQRVREATALAAAAKEEAEKKATALRLEKEQQARETAEETAARKKLEAEEARIVAEREAKKENAKAKQAELIEKEKARQDELKFQHEKARQAAELAHEKKIEALKRDLALTEAEKASQVAQTDQEYQEAEARRKAAATKEIDAAGRIDHSDERLGGALSGHASGGYYSLGVNSAPLVGGQITIRHGFWATAPAAGTASGVELRATGLFLAALTTPATPFIQGAAEFRYWFGRVSLGVAFEAQYFAAVAAADPLMLGLGPTISLAATDNPDARVFFTVRWLPVLNDRLSNHFERVTGEIEGGYGIFSFAVQGGVLEATATAAGGNPIGYFVGVSLGARLRW